MWNNTVITDNTEKVLNSSILRPQGINHLEQVVENNDIISFHKFTDLCNILPINAGRIIAGLRRHIKHDFVKENREGPSNHFPDKGSFPANDDNPLNLKYINI